jgi:hypothetical protein
MAKKRMGAKGDGRLLATAEMVSKLSKRILEYKSQPSVPEFLVELLNGDKFTPASKERVKRVLELLRTRQGYMRQVRAGLLDQRLNDSLISSMIDFSSELNQRLMRYEIIPQVDPLGAAFFRCVSASDSNHTSLEDEAEAGAVMCALQLDQGNQIENVRECACQEFFVAGRIDQNYCSVKCRVKANQSSEKFKAKRREADRARYKLHKDKKVKQANRRKNVAQKAR